MPVFAHLPPDIDPLSPAVLPHLRERILTSEQEGIPIRALLLCNPHNPIPQCYPLETIQGHLEIAREVSKRSDIAAPKRRQGCMLTATLPLQFNIHLISDELFAQSVFPTRRNPEPRPFISVLSLPEWSAESSLLPQIHVLGSMTKDLGLSGLKAALLVTENREIRHCVEVGLWATPISGMSDAAMTHLLSDDTRVDRLLAKNAKLLGQAMDRCADWAEFHLFPFVSSFQ